MRFPAAQSTPLAVPVAKAIGESLPQVPKIEMPDPIVPAAPIPRPHHLSYLNLRRWESVSQGCHDHTDIAASDRSFRRHRYLGRLLKPHLTKANPLSEKRSPKQS